MEHDRTCEEGREGRDDDPDDPNGKAENQDQEDRMSPVKIDELKRGRLDVGELERLLEPSHQPDCDARAVTREMRLGRFSAAGSGRQGAFAGRKRTRRRARRAARVSSTSR